MKLILKNAPIEERICLFSNQKFVNDNGLLFQDEIGRPLSWNEGIKREWEFDKDFRVPDNIKSREKLGQWLTSVGIKSTSQAYRDARRAYGENLNPFEVMDAHER